MKTIRLTEIIIPKSYERRPPKSKKINSIRDYVLKHGDLDRPLVLVGNVLVDNYARYLVAKECGFDEVPFVSPNEMPANIHYKMPIKYIVGVFKGNDKKYTWMVPKGRTVEVGDRVIVWSGSKSGKDRRVVVTVVDVFESDDYSLLRHKMMVRKK